MLFKVGRMASLLKLEWVTKYLTIIVFWWLQIYYTGWQSFPRTSDNLLHQTTKIVFDKAK